MPWDLFKDSSAPLSLDQVWALRCYLQGWVRTQAFHRAHQDSDSGVLAILTDMRKRTCMNIAEAEAARLRCSVQDVDYHSASWTDASGSADTDFDHLPDAVMHYVFAKLEVYDMVFAMFVCREWRRVGMDYMRILNKIEHAFTAHMLRRYCWPTTDCARGHTLTYWLKDWGRVGRSLLRWTARLCEALEIVVITVPLERDVLWSVVNACPQLKHLVAGMFVEGIHATESEVILELGDTNLETFIISATFEIVGGGDRLPQEVIFEICLPEKLSVLCLKDDPIDRYDEYVPATALFYASPMITVWNNLIALEWMTPEDLNLDEIRSLESLRLRYLHLSVPQYFLGDAPDSILFDLLIQRCPALSVLVLGDTVAVSDDSVRTLSQHCPQLQKAWIVNNHEANRFTPETLHQLEECMKLRAVPAADIHIVVLRDEVDELKQAAPSFTYVCENYNSKPPKNLTLHHREMRRFLGLEF